MDTSKHIFQLHGVNAAEEPALRKKLRRKEMVTFFEKLAPTVIGIEACSASNHWARLLQSFGHTVKLIAPQLVKGVRVAADTVGEIHVESAFGAKPIRVLTYRPVRSDNPLPVILHIHGGGFVMGTPEMKDVENRLFASELKCAIYSVDYRLAPEAPHPAPLEDIYSVFVGCMRMPAGSGLIPPASGSRAKAAAAVSRQGPHFMPATGRDRNSPFST